MGYIVMASECSPSMSLGGRQQEKRGWRAFARHDWYRSIAPSFKHSAAPAI
jgi:hypothetical protein